MLLTAAELPTYYPQAEQLKDNDKGPLLARANSYCTGFIGGIPPVLDWDTDQSNLKSIVALALEVFAAGKTSVIDDTNGNITEAAPSRSYTRAEGSKIRNDDPIAPVHKMLLPYKAAFESANATTADNGFMFLGRA